MATSSSTKPLPPAPWRLSVTRHGEDSRRRGVGAGSARPPRSGASERQLLSPSRRTAGRHRRHWNQRKEHDRFSGGSHSGCGGPQERADRHHRVSRGRQSSCPRRTPRPRRSDLNRILVGGAGQRGDRGGDGGFLARPGAAAGLRNSVRHRHLHQSDSRSPRLSPHHGGVFRIQASLVRGMRHGRAARSRCSIPTTNMGKSWPHSAGSAARKC